MVCHIDDKDDITMPASGDTQPSSGVRKSPTPAQRRVHEAIVSLSNQMGHAPTFREVAAEVGVNVSTVLSHVAGLEDGGWLRRRPHCPRTMVAHPLEDADPTDVAGGTGAAKESVQKRV